MSDNITTHLTTVISKGAKGSYVHKWMELNESLTTLKQIVEAEWYGSGVNTERT